MKQEIEKEGNKKIEIQRELRYSDSEDFINKKEEEQLKFNEENDKKNNLNKNKSLNIDINSQQNEEVNFNNFNGIFDKEDDMNKPFQNTRKNNFNFEVESNYSSMSHYKLDNAIILLSLQKLKKEIKIKNSVSMKLYNSKIKNDKLKYKEELAKNCMCLENSWRRNLIIKFKIFSNYLWGLNNKILFILLSAVVSKHLKAFLEKKFLSLWLLILKKLDYK